MKIIFVLIAFIGLSAHAQTLRELCQKDPFRLNYMGNLITNQKTIWNHQGEALLNLEEEVLSIAQGSNSYWVLKADLLQEITLTGELMNEYPLQQLFTAGWGKRLMSYGNTLYVLRETGLSSFDLETKSFRWNQQITHLNGTKTVDATGDGQIIYVVMASTMEMGFTGVVMINTSGELVRDLPIKRSYGVFANNARTHWNEKLYINNSGWMLTIDTKQLTGTKPLTPKLLPTAQQIEGARRQVSMLGDFYFDEGKFSGCASVSRLVDGQGRTFYDLYSFAL